MEKLRLGKTNLMVTRIGFGGIPIQRLPEEEAVAVVKRCLELGINFIDTANAYSTSEERIGKAIQDCRDRVIIATKTMPGSAAEFEEHLKLSLSRLKVDAIDLYQFHGVNDFKTLDEILATGGLLEVAGKAKADGLIKHIGITSHQIDVARKAVQSDRFETVMFPFNFVTSEAADQLLPLCRQHDVGFICMKPLAGGMLDNAPLAFKYLLQFPDVVPIPGIEKIAEIEEIVKLLERQSVLTAVEKQEITLMKESLGSRFCHRCDYCQPCSAGITISTVLTLKSFHKRLPYKGFLGMSARHIEKAAGCIDCGECEKRCPYQLPIRKLISEQLDWYRDLIAKQPAKPQ